MPVQPASWESLAGDLTDSLQLAQPPIAIAFVDQAPEGVPPYAGSAPAGCYFWQEASRRVFAVTATGERALAETRAMQDRLWDGVRLTPRLNRA